MRFRSLATFVALWGSIGFVLGTGLLIGPVTFATEYGRANGWSESFESNVVRALIVLLVIVSAAAAAWLTRAAWSVKERHLRATLVVAVILSVSGTVWLWMNPTLMGSGIGHERDVGTAFTFGPYPTAEKLDRLQRDGYTGVISLLHPAVVPFETRLIGEEREAVQAAGLEFHHAPMLPWVSDNRDSLASLETLARENVGRYYVHCYLGKDRTRIAQRVVAAASPNAHVTAEAAIAAHSERRKLRDGQRFERGKVVEIVDGVFVVPFPTDDEYTSWILTRRGVTVLSLLDPDNPDDRPWIDRERTLLDGNRVPFVERPLAADANDPQRALEIAREAQELPRPLIVHGFLALETGRAPNVESFVEAFRDLPPIDVAAQTETAGANESAGSPVLQGATRPALPVAAAGPWHARLVAAVVDLAWTAIPDARSWILLSPLFLLTGAAAAAFAGWLRVTRKVPAPYTRKIFHFLIFTLAGCVHITVGFSGVALYGGIVALLVLYAVSRGDDFPFYEAMARPTDAPHRSMFILIPLMTTAVGGLVSNALFGTFAFVGYLVVGWGDAIAEPVGTAFGRHRYKVPSLGGVPATRSLEGSAAVLLFGSVAAILGLMASGVPAPTALSIGLACGLAGTLLEAISNHGLDNLTVQIAASATAWLLLM